MKNYLSLLKSSAVKPASESIFFSKPLPMSVPVWMGIVIVLRVMWFTSVRWLPFCRSSSKPRFFRNRISFLAVMDGSFEPMSGEFLCRFLQHGPVSLLRQSLRNAPREILNGIPELRGYFSWLLQWSDRWKSSPANWESRRNSLFLFPLFLSPLQRNSISGGSYA